jgi:hypothetical protein
METGVPAGLGLMETGVPAGPEELPLVIALIGGLLDPDDLPAGNATLFPGFG